ncbi:MAG: biotin-dependent carboxyltransferase family protein [Halieaceae bacterium]|nr:biotin-dependent carboxyltransferase family protein [Halieaceae bacterium]
MTALLVEKAGPLSLLQDRGRFGRAALGLTTGGPMDPIAAGLANRLLQNDADATLIEISLGGLELRAEGDLQLAVTGADAPLLRNDEPAASWSVLDLDAGDRIAIGHPRRGCRSYLAVRGGFDIAPRFGSTATVLREGIGGLKGGALEAGDRLPVRTAARAERRWIPEGARPAYAASASLRVVLGYQHSAFPQQEQERFFSSAYRVSRLSDRMGYRLEGPALSCDSPGMLSEGIAAGAIQVPPDGQPIILLNDRQTIGGYPKLGCVLSLDCAALAQLRPGDTVHFAPITTDTASRALRLAAVHERNRRIEPIAR